MKKHLFLIKFFLLFVFVVGIAAPVFAKPGAWLGKIKKIELVKTTRVEIEKLFENPQVIEIEDLAVDYKNGWGKLVKYETKYGKLEVWYAAGKCSESKGKPYAYDVAADVAMMFTFFPNEIVFENQLGYNLSKFKTDVVSETDKTYSLETEKSKIVVEVKSLQVSSIEHDISVKYKTQLECKNVTVKEPVWFEKLRALELFKSTRSEVEALFDNPKILEIDDFISSGDDWTIDVDYETIYGELQVRYSTGKCAERQSREGYDAAQNTLVELKFIPSGDNDLTELNFDLRKFESDYSTHGGAWKSIPEMSLKIFFYKTSRIESVGISPNDEQGKGFECDKVWN
jgi:hypothetical protein